MRLPGQLFRLAASLLCAPLVLTLAACGGGGGGGGPASPVAQEWHQLTYPPPTPGIPTGYGFQRCSSVLVAKASYAGQESALMSTDHAATWQSAPLVGALPELGESGYFWRGPDIYGMGPYQETQDCGATWTTWSPLGSEPLVHCLAATIPDAVWRGGLSNSVIYARGYSPYAGFTLCISTDNAQSWTRGQAPPAAVAAVRGDRWFAVMNVPNSAKLLLRTDDQGQTWQSTGLYSLGYGLDLIRFTGHDAVMAVIATIQVPGTGGQSVEVLWQWDDATAMWRAAPPFPPAIDPIGVGSVAVNPATPRQIFLSLFTGGVFESRDTGVTWIDASAGLPNPLPRSASILFDPSLANRLYLSTITDIWALDITQ
jgi:hypothetical protein